MAKLRLVPVYVLLLTPLVLVGVAVATYAVNFPFWDDYLVQQHLLSIRSGGSLLRRLSLFFDQHWEHRIVWTRLIFYGFYKLNGTLNYAILPWIGLSGLVAVLGLLFLAFRRLRLPLLWFAPVPFWLFTLQSHENVIWAMASIQNFWVLAFALGAFYALARRTRVGRWAALVLAVTATFTSGNGALVLVAGLLLLIYQDWIRPGGHSRRIALGWLVGWTVTTSGCLLAYFYDYHRVTFFPSPFRYPFIDWIGAFFVFFGAFADPFPYSGTAALGYQNPIGLTIALGAVLMVGSGYFMIRLLTDGLPRLRNDYWARTSAPDVFWSDFFLGTMLFLLATAAITVYSRVGFAGPGYLLQGRYKIYSALTLSVVYLYSLSNWFLTPRWSASPRTPTSANPRRLAYPLAVLLTTVGLSLLSDYLCLEGVINQHRRAVAEHFNYLTNTPLDRQRAVASVYVPTEPAFFSGETAQIAARSWLLVPAQTAVDRVDDQRFMYNLPKSDAVNPTPGRPDEGSYVIMKSQTRTYLFAARPVRTGPMALSGFSAYFTSNQIYAQILKEYLVPGRYRIGILTHQNGGNRIAMTDQFVQFAGL